MRGNLGGERNDVGESAHYSTGGAGGLEEVRKGESCVVELKGGGGAV